jgi:hypothetical protein
MKEKSFARRAMRMAASRALRLAIVVGLILVQPATGTPALASNAWQLLAELDLRAVHRILEEQTLGSVDTNNTWFGDWWRAGLEKALARVGDVSTFEGYVYLVRYYVNGFNDGHISSRLTVDPSSMTTEWPGVLVGIRGGQYVVAHVDSADSAPSLVAKGDRLLSCDARSPEAILRADVFPFHADADTDGNWVRWAPRLLVYDGNPWAIRLSKCVFSSATRQFEVSLNWKPVAPGTLRPLLRDAGYGAPPQFGIRSVGNGGIWVTMPTFSAQNATDNAMYERIIAEAATWRGKPLIVFDLRGNTGGDARFRQIVRQLYGDDYIRSLGSSHPYNHEWTADWKVTKENIVGRTFNSPGGPEALARGDAVFRERFWILPPATQPSSNASNPVSARVVLLTDGMCASSCWQFVRDVLPIPGTKHVGAGTDTMTPYTNPKSVTLPSRLMALDYPQKVFRSPLIHFRKAFVPEHHYEGDMADTAAVEAWLLRLLNTPSPPK